MQYDRCLYLYRLYYEYTYWLSVYCMGGKRKVPAESSDRICIDLSILNWDRPFLNWNPNGLQY